MQFLAFCIFQKRFYRVFRGCRGQDSLWITQRRPAWHLLLDLLQNPVPGSGRCCKEPERSKQSGQIDLAGLPGHRTATETAPIAPFALRPSPFALRPSPFALRRIHHGHQVQDGFAPEKFSVRCQGQTDTKEVRPTDPICAGAELPPRLFTTARD